MKYKEYDKLIQRLSAKILLEDEKQSFFVSNEIRDLFLSAIENALDSRSKKVKEIAIKDWIDWINDRDEKYANQCNLDFSKAMAVYNM